MMITLEDIIVIDSTSMLCSACGDKIEVQPEPDGEDTALSVQELYDIACDHIARRHR